MQTELEEQRLSTERDTARLQQLKLRNKELEDTLTDYEQVSNIRLTVSAQCGIGCGAC